MPEYGQAYLQEGQKVGTFLVAASDTSLERQNAANFRCDGTADDVEFQAAVDALPDDGGEVVLTEGAFACITQITRAIDNVSIRGAGAGTTLTLDGATAIISAGSQAGWSIENINTDAGGVDISSATESNANYWKADVWTAEPTSVGTGSRSATLVVAASDAATASKNGADYLGDGTADEVQVNAAIAALP